MSTTKARLIKYLCETDGASPSDFVGMTVSEIIAEYNITNEHILVND